MTDPPPARCPAAAPRFMRWVLAFMGVVSVGIGAVGVFVPGLPTTVFLIAATWCFARSCPWLERKLIRNRFFAPFLAYLDGTQPISLRSRLATLGVMWLFVGIAVVALWSREGKLGWLPAIIIGAACVGTVAIMRWRASRATEAVCHAQASEADN